MSVALSRDTELIVERAADRAVAKLTDTLRALIAEAVASQVAGAEYLSTAEAAEFIGLAVGTLELWRSRGEGPAHVRLGRRVVYRKADVEAWLDANRRGGGRP